MKKTFVILFSIGIFVATPVIAAGPADSEKLDLNIFTASSSSPDNNINSEQILPPIIVDKTARLFFKNVKGEKNNNNKEVTTTVIEEAKDENGDIDAAGLLQAPSNNKIPAPIVDNLVDAEEDKSDDKIGQSGMNKAISSVSTAAIGIGSMQLAQGLAEKKADKEAIRDMQDYLSKLYCSYSNKRANYGDVNITLDAEHRLDLLREEYFNKAAELKNTKEQLGLKAGIESEVILDEKTTGLYEYQDLGRASSTFGRLSEALLDENSRDAQMLAEQQATSQKRVTGGAIALGAGVVTSIGGHALVNAVAKKKAEQEANETNNDTSTPFIPAETTQNDGGGNTNDNSITTENNESETETPTETDNNSPDSLTVAGLRNILSNPIPLAMPPLPEEELQIKNSINNNTNLNFEKRLDVRPANSGVNEVQLNGKEI
ncbi:MAG: hypothetical protein GX944_02705, partial [Alphaproteobacteria bacterium]|nr:hypothetical protein [Alphaproteobacteria bacterium]